MYRELNKKELNLFIDKYFKEWGNDIKKVSVISYNGVDEYLVNECYLFIISGKI
ncbi:MAG: hypothetical protein J6B64_00740 [Bacilli bacterium]|nr:hypothetical protein [Bacilli bacterium]MBP3635398.1 hypothetical protein [Bacilli bacterium]